MKISGYIITFNEEKHITQCLDTLGFCDEIVIVDSNSSDHTLLKINVWTKKNKKIGLKLVNQPFKGFVAQKNFAIKQCSNDWVFNLDADERVSPALRSSIDALKNKPDNLTNNEMVAFTMNRRNWYIDTWVNYSGWYPDTKIRLFHKKYGKWDGRLLHETVTVFGGKKSHLQGDILHYSYANISDHVKKIDKYTTISANEEFLTSKNIFFVSIFVRMITTFLRSYVVKRGFLDGKTGLVIAVMSAYHTFLKCSKLWYLHRTTQR